MEGGWSGGRRKESRLMKMYEGLLGGGKRKEKGVIGVGRKLVVVIWNML